MAKKKVKVKKGQWFQENKIPKKFIKAERAIARAIKSGKIPKYYYKHGKRYESNPYALARKVTGYYGTTKEIGMIHKLKVKRRK